MGHDKHTRTTGSGGKHTARRGRRAEVKAATKKLRRAEDAASETAELRSTVGVWGPGGTIWTAPSDLVLATAPTTEEVLRWGSLRARALALCAGPFRYDATGGYIWDARNEMFADTRIRGWGRISKLENAAALQDKLGELLAEALTEYWERNA